MPLLWDWKKAAVAEAVEYIWSTGLYYYCVHTCSRVYVGDATRGMLIELVWLIGVIAWPETGKQLSKLVAPSPDRAVQRWGRRVGEASPAASPSQSMRIPRRQKAPILTFANTCPPTCFVRREL
jgi:hypothetical protein